MRWLLGSCYGTLGDCYVVARLFEVVARQLLGTLVIAGLFEMVARELLGYSG